MGRTRPKTLIRMARHPKATCDSLRDSIIACAWVLAFAFAHVGCSYRHSNSLQPSSMQITFRVVENEVTPTLAGAQAKFAFHNATRRAIHLPGFFGQPPKNGTFQPNFVQYEVESAGGWHRL